MSLFPLHHGDLAQRTTLGIAHPRIARRVRAELERRPTCRSRRRTRAASTTPWSIHRGRARREQWRPSGSLSIAGLRSKILAHAIDEIERDRVEDVDWAAQNEITNLRDAPRSSPNRPACRGTSCRAR